MAAQNFKKEDWENGDTKLGQNWHKNFQACNCIFFKQNFVAMLIFEVVGAMKQLLKLRLRHYFVTR